MPIYEYECKKCGNFFSELVFGEEEVHCPKCKSKRIERQFSAFAVGGESSSGKTGQTGPTCPHSGGT